MVLFWLRFFALCDTLHDDLETVCLSQTLIAAPPLELWSEAAARAPIPEDVE